MKTQGIIGGIAPESTIEYYSFIIESFRKQEPDGNYPSLFINSVNLKQMIELITANRLAEIADILTVEIQKLARAGADFALLASNTPHIVFDELERRSPIPLLSIVQSTCDAAKAIGLKKVGLFGTRFTMQGKFYPDTFARQGITLVTPEADDQNFIHTKYMGELINGVFLDETRQALLEILERFKQATGIEGLILGGTELPIILREAAQEDFPFLDTTKIHVAAAVARMFAD